MADHTICLCFSEDKLIYTNYIFGVLSIYEHLIDGMKKKFEDEPTTSTYRKIIKDYCEGDVFFKEVSYNEGNPTTDILDEFQGFDIIIFNATDSDIQLMCDDPFMRYDVVTRRSIYTQ